MGEDQEPTSGLPVASEVPLVYSNVVQMTVGAFDLIMDFGFKSPEDAKEQDSDPERAPRYTPLVRVAMSHAHAKSMLPILARLIADFEKQQGSIPSPGFGTFSKE